MKSIETHSFTSLFAAKWRRNEAIHLPLKPAKKYSFLKHEPYFIFFLQTEGSFAELVRACVCMHAVPHPPFIQLNPFCSFFELRITLHTNEPYYLLQREIIDGIYFSSMPKQNCNEANQSHTN